MKEQLEQQLVEIINTALEAGKSAIDFTIEQTPLLVQEILAFNLYSNIVYVIMSLISLVATFWLAKYIIKKWDVISDCDCDALVLVFGSVGGLITLFISICVFFESIIDIGKIIFAPRLYLLEYVSVLVK